MNNAKGRLKQMKELGIYFARVPGHRKGVYSWVSLYDGRMVETGAIFWHCVRNTWFYLEKLKRDAGQ